MTFEFPYPETGTTKRPQGQGCTTCVHKGYCRALYWFMRWDNNWPNTNVGTQCASWSTNTADMIPNPNANDYQENTRMNEEEILVEVGMPMASAYANRHDS